MEPTIDTGAGGFCAVRGTFYRAVDPAHRDAALAGSRSPGRYSRADEPTLYLSSSREGVAAAMIAHADQRAPALEVLAFEVDVEAIVDLRDASAAASIGVDLVDAAAPWQPDVAEGRTPPSWHVRDALIAAGARGLIDPSRQRPGLWHLVLFEWKSALHSEIR
ncbi:RES family NAD+ phosphorylase [Paramicrobacterium agarici]|uniref:RES family NAD+ phosphorylase n=1 Tax=Paramicrobacterium agarici TaxID=630514 RepID=UPI00116B2D3F|nr:RES family NAD+ phosphorylase [Microbacterium agarici]TQO22479.1 RES domain-containing protein [Microbacterium agarici]